MISPTAETIRLFLHVLAACVWVGGQLVLGALVPKVRRTNPEALRTIAQAFGRVAWPSFAVAVGTGLWNLMAVDPAEHGNAYLVTLAVKLGLVAVAAMSALVHANSRSRLGLALGGAIGLVSSLAVVWFGILLAQAG
ncbi:MAG: hypothetical protein EBS32_07980 [Actinobacteria bacterium]|nr:hypothetical protein [Actinomycetota bacterium]